MTTKAPDAAVLKRNRISLLLVFAMFAAPVVTAWLLFFVFPQWVPVSSSNHGTLIKPVRPLPAFHLQTTGGKTIGADILQGEWTFVYLHRGPCAKNCVEQLYKMRQIRLTQGKNIDRVQRLMLWDTQGVQRADLEALQQHFPGQITAIVTPQASALLQSFATDGQVALDAQRLYLVDPLGNLMMSYTVDDAPHGIIRDLERLLKYSGLG